jgi:hypothetical protein
MNSDLSAMQSKLVPIEQWLSDDSLEDIYSSVYWNDIEEERKNCGGLLTATTPDA